MTLENLLRIGKLKAHAAGKVEIDRLLAAAERALADATLNDLSSVSRLDLAYRAIMRRESGHRLSDDDERGATAVFVRVGAAGDGNDIAPRTAAGNPRVSPWRRPTLPKKHPS